MEGVCVGRCVSTFRGVVDRTQAELKTAAGKLSVVLIKPLRTVVRGELTQITQNNKLF